MAIAARTVQVAGIDGARGGWVLATATLHLDAAGRSRGDGGGGGGRRELRRTTLLRRGGRGRKDDDDDDVPPNGPGDVATLTTADGPTMRISDLELRFLPTLQQLRHVGAWRRRPASAVPAHPSSPSPARHVYNDDDDGEEGALRATVAVDMPIGLDDVALRGGRACDAEARRFLSLHAAPASSSSSSSSSSAPHRREQRRAVVVGASSIFSPPSREALQAFEAGADHAGVSLVNAGRRRAVARASSPAAGAGRVGERGRGGGRGGKVDGEVRGDGGVVRSLRVAAQRHVGATEPADDAGGGRAEESRGGRPTRRAAAAAAASALSDRLDEDGKAGSTRTAAEAPGDAFETRALRTRAPPKPSPPQPRREPTAGKRPRQQDAATAATGASHQDDEEQQDDDGHGVGGKRGSGVGEPGPGPGLSIQSFHIMPKILELDRLLLDRPPRARRGVATARLARAPTAARSAPIVASGGGGGDGGEVQDGAVDVLEAHPECLFLRLRIERRRQRPEASRRVEPSGTGGDEESGGGGGGGLALWSKKHVEGRRERLHLLGDTLGYTALASLLDAAAPAPGGAGVVGRHRSGSGTPLPRAVPGPSPSPVGSEPHPPSPAAAKRRRRSVVDPAAAVEVRQREDDAGGGHEDVKPREADARPATVRVDAAAADRRAVVETLVAAATWTLPPVVAPSNPEPASPPRPTSAATDARRTADPLTSTPAPAAVRVAADDAIDALACLCVAARHALGVARAFRGERSGGAGRGGRDNGVGDDDLDAPASPSPRPSPGGDGTASAEDGRPPRVRLDARGLPMVIWS